MHSPARSAELVVAKVAALKAARRVVPPAVRLARNRITGRVLTQEEPAARVLILVVRITEEVAVEVAVLAAAVLAVAALVAAAVVVLVILTSTLLRNPFSSVARSLLRIILRILSSFRVLPQDWKSSSAFSTRSMSNLTK